MQISVEMLRQNYHEAMKAIQEIKCVRAYILGAGMDDKRYPWEAQILNAVTILETYTEILKEITKQPENQEKESDNTLHQYVTVIDGKYVSEVRYCKVDDPESLHEEDWAEDLHRPIYLETIDARNAESAIRLMAAKYNISPKSVKAIPVTL